MRIAALRGAPKVIRVDNGPKFVSKALDRWRTRTASRWTSAARVSRPTMPLWNRSMVACATNA